MASALDKYINFIKEKELDSFYKGIIERGLVPEHSGWLAELLQKEQFPTILEIGRYKGWSLGLLKFFQPDSFVFSVDIFLFPEVQRVVRHFPDKVCLIHGNSDLLWKLPISFDLVLIDGDHSYEGCRKDWLNVKDKLNAGAVVLFDDLPSNDGCGKVFFDLSDKDFEKTRVHNMGVARKKPHG